MKRLLARLILRLGYRVERLRPSVKPFARKFEYQRLFADFAIPKGARVLDVGSGGEPFPFATVLAERFVERSNHRSAVFRDEGRDVVICDIDDLPFVDDAFDYVYCSHVLEHVDDPAQACRELQRVAGRGYIETPNAIKDMLFCWGGNMHRWMVTAVANRLVFVEHSRRTLQGIRSDYYRASLRLPNYHPFQDVFARNQDLFNSMFEWHSSFGVDVFRRDGHVQRVDP